MRCPSVWRGLQRLSSSSVTVVVGGGWRDGGGEAVVAFLACSGPVSGLAPAPLSLRHRGWLAGVGDVCSCSPKPSGGQGACGGAAGAVVVVGPIWARVSQLGRRSLVSGVLQQSAPRVSTAVVVVRVIESGNPPW